MGLFEKATGKSVPRDKVIGYAPPLTKEECTLLLLMLEETTFKGKDIEVLYELISKIQEMYNYYND